MQRAVIAAEDGRFYEHNGIDWLELEKVVEEVETRGRFRRRLERFLSSL